MTPFSFGSLGDLQVNPIQVIGMLFHFFFKKKYNINNYLPTAVQ